MWKDPKLRVTLLTGRTLEQGIGKEQGKTSKEYVDSASACFIDPSDLKKLGIEENANVLVSTTFGSIVVKALSSPQAPHEGVIFIPYGPWANAIVGPETENVGMPSLKDVPAEIEPAYGSSILSLAELLEKQFGKKTYAGR